MQASIVSPVRHDLAVHNHSTQALVCTPQSRPNRGMDMVGRHEAVALTFVFHFVYSSSSVRTRIINYSITLAVILCAIDRRTHDTSNRPKGSHDTGEVWALQERKWQGYQSLLDDTPSWM